MLLAKLVYVCVCVCVCLRVCVCVNFGPSYIRHCPVKFSHLRLNIVLIYNPISSSVPVKTATRISSSDNKNSLYMIC